MKTSIGQDRLGTDVKEVEKQAFLAGMHLDGSVVSFQVALNRGDQPSEGTLHCPQEKEDKGAAAAVVGADVTGAELERQQHSFTGGGTYLQPLDCVVSLSRGEALTFPGQLLHGGVGLTSGVRYALLPRSFPQSCAHENEYWTRQARDRRKGS